MDLKSIQGWFESSQGDFFAEIGINVKRYDDGNIAIKIRRKPETTKYELKRLVDEGIDKVEEMLGKL